MATVRNAVSNASTRVVGDPEIVAVLESGNGAGHVVRAVFGDCAADTLLAVAEDRGQPIEQLKSAYRTARLKHLAANETMDAIAEGSFT